LKDYYYILSVNKKASLAEIKKAYRKLSKKNHPDTNNGDKYFEERFKEIQEAYEVLSDTNRRQNYDWKYSKTNSNAYEKELKRKEQELNSKNNTSKVGCQSQNKTGSLESSKEYKSLIYLFCLFLSFCFAFYFYSKNSNEFDIGKNLNNPRITHDKTKVSELTILNPTKVGGGFNQRRKDF